MSTDADDPLSAELAATLAAVDQLLEPLARLCVGKGVAIQAVDERMRLAFVRAARAICERDAPEHPKDRLTSRLSTMTGLTRREVSRLEAQAPARRNASRSRVSEVFARWLADPGCRDADGRPAVIPRQGPHPSFESLAFSVTRDVHPRSLLEEMIRQDAVIVDDARDMVELRHDAFVPRGQTVRMLAFLGDNVGDHLEAAVTNVLGAGNEHFEQALFADELSTQAIGQAQQLVSGQWRYLMTTIAPALQDLMDEDRVSGRPQDQCLRLGLYSLTRPMPAAGTPEPPNDEEEDRIE